MREGGINHNQELDCKGEVEGQDNKKGGSAGVVCFNYG